jgi:hypothetical protein
MKANNLPLPTNGVVCFLAVIVIILYNSCVALSQSCNDNQVSKLYSGGLIAIHLDSGLIYAADFDDKVFTIDNTGNIRTLIDPTSIISCSSPITVYSSSIHNIVAVGCFWDIDSTVLLISNVNSNPTTVILANSTECPFVRSVVIDSGGKVVYAACENAIMKYTLDIDNNLIQAVELVSSNDCRSPFHLYFDKFYHMIYAACYNTGIVSINVTTSVVSLLVPYHQCYSGTYVYRDSQDKDSAIYAVCGDGIVQIYNSQVQTVITSKECPNPSVIYRDRSTNLLFAGCQPGGIISIPEDGINNDKSIAVVASSAVCNSPISLVMNPYNGNILATCLNNGILSINGRAPVNIVPDTECPAGYQIVMYDNSTIYVTCSSTGAGRVVLAVTNNNNLITLTRISGCDEPMAIVKLKSIFYMPCFNGGIVSVDEQDPTFPTARLIMSKTECMAMELQYDRLDDLFYAICYNGTIYTLVSFHPNITLDASPRVLLTTSPTSLCNSLSSISKVGGILYVACSYGPIIVINTTSLLVNEIISKTNCFDGRKVSFDGNNILFAACAEGVFAINTATRSFTKLTNRDDCYAFDMFIDSSTLYIACYFTGILAIEFNSTSLATNNRYFVVSSGECVSASAVFKDVNNGIIYAGCKSGIVAIGQNFNCIPGYEWDSGSCIACSIGKHKSLNQTRCNDCTSGYVASRPAAAQCEMCIPGFYAASPFLPCQPCSKGFYSSIFGAIECHPCNAGFYGDLLNATSSNCSGFVEKGYWSTAGSTSSKPFLCGARSVFCPLGSDTPQNIDPGFYSAQPTDPLNTDKTMSMQLPCELGHFCDGSGAQMHCPIGTIANISGSSICVTCADGYYADFSNTICYPCELGSICTKGLITKCPVGSFNNNPMKTICFPCELGKYSDTLGSPFCSQCNDGYFTLTNGSVQCIPCASGSFLSISESSLLNGCKPCPPGKFQSNPASSICMDCIPGTYSEFNATQTCSPCPSGTYNDRYGGTKCDACHIGEAQPQSGSTFCVKCNTPQYPRTYSPGGIGNCLPCSGTISSDSGSCSTASASGCLPGYRYINSECVICEVGKASEGALSDTCKPCRGGTYNMRSGSSVCFNCETGATCINGIASVNINYWASVRLDNEGEPRYSIKSCPPLGLCIGGAQLQYHGPFGINATLLKLTQSQINSYVMFGADEQFNRNVSSSSLSSPQSQCAPNRISKFDNYLCGQCLPEYSQWRNSCVYCETKGWLIAVLAIFAFIYVIIVHILSQPSTDPTTTGADVKIFVYFVQTALFQIGSFDKFLSWLQIFNFNPSQASGDYCPLPLSSYEQLGVQAIIPLLLFGYLFFIMIFHYALSKLYHRCQNACIAHKTTNKVADNQSQETRVKKNKPNTLTNNDDSKEEKKEQGESNPNNKLSKKKLISTFQFYSYNRTLI